MHSLKERIIERIKSEGPINFERFMEMALYYPEIGYYMRDRITIGKEGDFYTSPHLHPLFGYMIARQIEEMWHLMDRPDPFYVIEMGAGMGYLAMDILEYLKKKTEEGEDIFENIRYSIIELNPSLRARQRDLLSDFSDKVEWFSSLKEMKPVKGCFLSNELLDAFPVRLVQMDKGLKEIYVSVKDNDFTEIKMPPSEEVRGYFEEFGIELPEDYRTEVNLRIKEWLKDLESKLLEGFILTIDYGYTTYEYYSEERNRGTLLCYYKHQINEDPYQNIGEQDITAHVNFSSLKKWGDELGIKTLGFCPQGTYFVSLGIDKVIKELYGESHDFFEIAKIKGLILPQGMGDSHNVMIQYKGSREFSLKGFRLRNRASYLLSTL